MGVQDGQSRFLVERLARATGVTRLTVAVLDDERYAPYLFVLAAALLERPIPTVVNYVRGTTASIPFVWWRWPGLLWWLVPLVLLLGVFWLRVLRDRSYQALRNAGKASDDGPIVDPVLPRGLQAGLLGVGMAVYGLWFLSEPRNVFATDAVYNTVRWMTLVPGAYVPVATDLATWYCQVEVVVPQRIRAAAVPLDFADPQRLGGMYPIGRVMQAAALAVFSALTLYTVYWFAGFSVAPALIPAADRVGVTAVFAVAWTLSILGLAAGVYLMHQHMQAAREAQITDVLARTREFGDDSEPVPYTAPSDDVESQRVLQEYIILDLVERTRTVPFNVAVTWELVVGAIFPVALQVLTFVVEPL